MWLGTVHSGISRYDGKTFTNFTESGIIKGDDIWSICKDSAGNVWFSAKHFGVYRYDGNAFTNLNQADGLASNGIMCVFEDKQKRIWCGGVSGLFLFDGTAFRSITKKALNAGL